MKTLSSRLNLTTTLKDLPIYAVELDTRKDIAVYDTLCLYCANNDIDLSAVTDKDFNKTSDMIQYFMNALDYHTKIAFWINK